MAKSDKKTIAPRNIKGVYSTCNQMFASIMNGDADLERARLALDYLREGNRVFENELKLMALTGGEMRRIESTGFDNTTGEQPIVAGHKLLK